MWPLMQEADGEFWQKQMSSEASFQTAKIYRHLLKAVQKHIGKEDNKRHFREFITSEFRKNSSLSNGAAVQQKIKLAQDYTFLLNSVHHHKALFTLFLLLFSINFRRIIMKS